MPDHIGAFLKASRCFASLGINITRVSYNKAVDSHTLFLDAEGPEEQLKKADLELKNIGYLQNSSAASRMDRMSRHLKADRFICGFSFMFFCLGCPLNCLYYTLIRL